MARRPAVTPENVASAEKLAGIEFTSEERKQIISALAIPMLLYERRRSVVLENGVAPALEFDPRLPGTSFETHQHPWVRSGDEAGTLPGCAEDIAFAPLTRLSRWIERGELTSERLTTLYLERLARFGDRLACVVTRMEGHALARARCADQEIAAGHYRGPLHGIPWGAKDLLDTAGVATGWGVSLYENRIPERDAEVVQRLDRAGAVLVAKLSLGELAQGDVWHRGRTRNPWKLDDGSDGSSAGPAAAVASGLVGFAIGSETLGSITVPSATCGVVGLRPTFGRVPRSGAMALAWSLDKLGPLARGVEDTALILAAIHGAHEGDPGSITLPLGFDAGEPVHGLRVGYVPSWFEDPFAGRSERCVLEALREIGTELVPVTIPDLPYETILLTVQVEAAAAFEELTTTNRDDELCQQDDGAWPNIFRTARLVPAVEFIQMLRVRRRIMEAARDLFATVDAIVAPGPGMTLLTLTNATGHPSLTLRAGFTKAGTPAAVTIHGQLFEEGRLCRIGMALEKHLGVSERRPDLG